MEKSQNQIQAGWAPQSKPLCHNTDVFSLYCLHSNINSYQIIIFKLTEIDIIRCAI